MRHTASPIRIILALIVVLPLIAAVPARSGHRAGQSPCSLPSWYVPRAERLKLYDRVQLSSGEGYHTLINALWITPSVARAFASFSVDRDKACADVAETRYGLLRSPFEHFILVQLRETPFGIEGLKISARLELKAEDRVVACSVRQVPFPMGGVDTKSPYGRGFLAVFPRSGVDGRNTIRSLDDEIRLVVQLPGQPVPIRIKPRKFAETLADL
jgi:hypothetical protein